MAMPGIITALLLLYSRSFPGATGLFCWAAAGWRRSPRRPGLLLQLQQKTLFFQTAAVACQAPVRAHDPVAGDQDGDRVAVVGHAHRPAGVGPSDLAGQLAVGDGLAIGDGEQGVPHQPLKIRPGGGEGQVEAAPLPGKILPQLLRAPLQQGAGGTAQDMISEEKARDSLSAAGKGEEPDGAAEPQGVTFLHGQKTVTVQVFSYTRPGSSQTRSLCWARSSTTSWREGRLTQGSRHT